MRCALQCVAAHTENRLLSRITNARMLRRRPYQHEHRVVARHAVQWISGYINYRPGDGRNGVSSHSRASVELDIPTRRTITIEQYEEGIRIAPDTKDESTRSALRLPRDKALISATTQPWFRATHAGARQTRRLHTHHSTEQYHVSNRRERQGISSQHRIA
jgi:hypothetical protein